MSSSYFVLMILRYYALIMAKRAFAKNLLERKFLTNNKLA